MADKVFYASSGKSEGGGKKREQVKSWLDKINRAKKVKDKWRQDFRTDLAWNYFKGFQRPPYEQEDDWITLNLVYSTVLAMLPNLYNEDPYFYITLKKSYSPNPMDIALYEKKAKMRQAMLNYLKGELRLKKKGRLSVQEAFFKYGVLKICYHSELVENPDAGSLMYDDNARPIMNGETGDYFREPDLLPANESYKILRINSDDHLVDEDATPLDYNWCAQRIIEPLEKVKKNKNYSAAARKLVRATAVKEDSYDSTRRDVKKKSAFGDLGSDKKEPDLVVMWELYDRESKEWFLLAEDCEEYMVAPKPVPPGIEGDPFVTIRFTLDLDGWYPIPPASQWLDSQREINLTRSRFLKHRKRFNRKYEADAKLIGDNYENEIDKLVDGDDGTVVVKNGTLAPGVPAIQPIKDAPLDQQMHTEYAYQRKDFDDLAIGANQRGAAQGIDSATEAGILEFRAKVREGDWRGLVVDFLSEAGRKIDQQVAANVTQAQAVKVVGPEGESWELIRETDYDDIAGEYEYSANVGTMAPQIPEIERAQWLAFLTAIGQFPQLAMSEQLLKEAARMHNINNELMLQEIRRIAGAMVAGQAMEGKGPVSMPGISNQNPATFAGGGQGIANFRGGR